MDIKDNFLMESIVQHWHSLSGMLILHTDPIPAGFKILVDVALGDVG